MAAIVYGTVLRQAQVRYGRRGTRHSAEQSTPVVLITDRVVLQDTASVD